MNLIKVNFIKIVATQYAIVLNLYLSNDFIPIVQYLLVCLQKEIYMLSLFYLS